MAHARKVHNPFASGSAAAAGGGGGGGGGSGLTAPQRNAGGFRDYRYKASSHPSRRSKKTVGVWSTVGYTVLVVFVFLLLRSLFNYSTSTPVAVRPAVVSSSKGRNRIGATTGDRDRGRDRGATTTLKGTGRIRMGSTGTEIPPRVPVHPTKRLDEKKQGNPDSNFREHIGNRVRTKEDDDQDKEHSDADGDADADAITPPRLSKIAPPSIRAVPNSDPISQDDNTPVVQDDTINNTKPLNTDKAKSTKNTTSAINDQGSVFVPQQYGIDNTTTQVHVAANSTNNNTASPDIDTNNTEIHRRSNDNLTISSPSSKTNLTVNATSDRATPDGSMTGSNNTSNSTHDVLSNNNETIGISDATTNNVTTEMNGTIPINATTLLPPTVLSPNVTDTTWSDATIDNVTNETNGTIPINATSLLPPTVLSPNVTDTTNTASSDATTDNVTNETNGTIPINATSLLPPTVLSSNVTNTTDSRRE